MTLKKTLVILSLSCTFITFAKDFKKPRISYTRAFILYLRNSPLSQITPPSLNSARIANSELRHVVVPENPRNIPQARPESNHQAPFNPSANIAGRLVSDINNINRYNHRRTVSEQIKPTVIQHKRQASK